MKLLKKLFGRSPAETQIEYKQKKRFTSFGNCQAHPIAQLLMLDNQFNKHFEYVPFKKPAYMLTADDQDYVNDLVSSVDLFIHQNVGEAFGKMFSTDNLLALTKHDCQKVSFPSIYFSAYTPEINYLRFVGGGINSFSDYHDINVVNHFLENPESCLEQSLSQYQSTDYYSSEEILSNANDSLLTLREREQQCSVKVANYIEQHWRDRRLFFSMNHPSNEMLYEVVSQILQLMNLPKTKTHYELDMLGDTHLPLYRSVQSLMKFESPLGIRVRKVEMNLSNYIQNSLKVYESIPSAKLKHNLAHLKKAKVPLVEKYISVL